MSEEPSSLEELHPIRTVAAETGLTPATLRVWERRYGRPVPVRLPSGHRRYTGEQLRWLRRVSEALSKGHRASDVVPAEPQRLDAILGRGRDRKDSLPQLSTWFDYVRAFDADALGAALRETAGESESPLQFVDGVVSPLLRIVGEAWADGEVDVRHEHFATNVVADVLRLVRDELPAPGEGRPVVLATLPGEDHILPLSMADLLVRAHGLRTTFLGIETPLPDIAATARETNARAVVVAVSPVSAGVANDRVLAELRADLPDGVPLLVGGDAARGARRGPRGVTYLRNFPEFDKWLKEHSE